MIELAVGFLFFYCFHMLGITIGCHRLLSWYQCAGVESVVACPVWVAETWSGVLSKCAYRVDVVP